MGGEWEKVKLGDEIELLTGFPFKSELYTDSDEGIRLLRGDNIVQGTLRWDGVKKFPKENSSEYTSYQLLDGDVVLAMDRPWIEAGLKFAVISKADLPCLLVQRTARLRGKGKLHTKFLRYVIGSRDFTNYILSVQTGTAVPHISGNQIKDFWFNRPPLPIQRRIASILGSLDDKIELNRQMNATLEEMARALFQSWFVDFDPVHVKAQGKQPVGMDAETAALFPDSFDESELGLIPKGWRVEIFGDHLNSDRGFSYKGEGLTGEKDGIPMHNLNSVFEGGGYKHAGIKFYKGETKEKHIINHGDMIVTNTEQGFDYLLIGHAAIVPKCYGSKAIFSHHLYRVKTKENSALTSHYLVHLFNNPRWHYWICGFSNGTTVNMLPPDALIMPKLVVPPSELIRKFTKTALAVAERCEVNLEENRSLSSLRDALLPKLLSGEVCFPNTEEMAKEAG